MSEVLTPSRVEAARTRLLDFFDEFGVRHQGFDTIEQLRGLAVDHFVARGINPTFTDDVLALVANGYENHATVGDFRKKLASTQGIHPGNNQHASGAELHEQVQGDWRESAACIGSDPEMFFPNPEMYQGKPTSKAERAIAICIRCPVLEECLQYALKDDISHGIWGGRTSEQLAILRRKIARRTTDIL